MPLDNENSSIHQEEMKILNLHASNKVEIKIHQVQDFPDAPVVKNLPCKVEDSV